MRQRFGRSRPRHCCAGDRGVPVIRAFGGRSCAASAILARGERGELFGELGFHGRRELLLGAHGAQRGPGIAADDAADHQRDGGEHRAHAVLLRLRRPSLGRAIAHQLNDGRRHGGERADDGGENGFGKAHSRHLKQARDECIPGSSRRSAGAFRGGYWVHTSPPRSSARACNGSLRRGPAGAPGRRFRPGGLPPRCASQSCSASTSSMRCSASCAPPACAASFACISAMPCRAVGGHLLADGQVQAHVQPGIELAAARRVVSEVGGGGFDDDVVFRDARRSPPRSACRAATASAALELAPRGAIHLAQLVAGHAGENHRLLLEAAAIILRRGGRTRTDR